MLHFSKRSPTMLVVTNLRISCDQFSIFFKLFRCRRGSKNGKKSAQYPWFISQKILSKFLTIFWNSASFFSKLLVVKYWVKMFAQVALIIGFIGIALSSFILCIISEDNWSKYSVVMELIRLKFIENLRGNVCDINMSRLAFWMSDQSQKANASERWFSDDYLIGIRYYLQLFLFPLNSKW